MTTTDQIILYCFTMNIVKIKLKIINEPCKIVYKHIKIIFRIKVSKVEIFKHEVLKKDN